MRILVDINHPAHVHFFSKFIEQFKSKGHEVIVTASDKDIAIQLLEEKQIEFIHLGTYGRSVFYKLLSIPIMAWRMFKVVLKHKPDYLMGIASSRITHGAIFSKGKALVFTDTEHAKEQIALYKPLAFKIVTPTTFNLDLGPKQVKYEGYHELAYLHPNQFTPNPESLKEANIDENDVFFVLRMVSYEASHDIGRSAMSAEELRSYINILEKHGKVFLSVEGSIPKEFEKYLFRFEAQKILDFLYYSSMYIGDGGTMAIEAAILGTPTLHTNPLTAGVIVDLETNYQLIKRIENKEDRLTFIESIVKDIPKSKGDWKLKKEKMLENKIDVTDWMINFVENLEK